MGIKLKTPVAEPPGSPLMLGYLVKDDAPVMAHEGAAKKRVKRKQKKSKPALPNDFVKNVAPE